MESTARYALLLLCFAAVALSLRLSSNNLYEVNPGSSFRNIFRQEPEEVVNLGYKSPNIFYISYTTNAPSAAPSGSTVILEALFDGDDFPFVRVPLPWQFDFFGVGIHNVYASPNGALHSTPVAPCPDCLCFQSGTSCNYNNSYYGIIAGLQSDLFPARYKDGKLNVTATTSESSVTVQYANVPFYSGSTNNTFDTEPVVVGLRNFKNNSLTTFTPAQLSVAKQYSTTVQGIYPPKASVVSGAAFRACPVSTVWCATPAILNINSLPSLSLWPLSISCLDTIDVVIYVVSSTVATVTVDLSASSSSVAPCTPSLHDTSLTCDVASLPSNYLVVSNISIGVAWRVSTATTSSYTAMSLVDPISLQLTPSHQSTTCSVNEDILNCGNTCSLCGGTPTCLGLTCDNATDPVLYSYPVCNNTCYGTHSIDDLYYDATNDLCCDEDQVDCMGACYGTSTPAPLSNGVEVCCTEAELDCMGICKGNSEPDACGVCNGDDVSGVTCDTGVDVYTNSPEPNTMMAPLYVLNASHASSLFIINVSNTNDTSISVELSIQDDYENSQVAPRIVFPVSSATLPGFSWRAFEVNVSLSDLYNQYESAWMVKQINVRTLREGDYATLQYRVFVYPSVLNCEDVDSSDVCALLPSCIFCDAYQYIRILTEEEEESNEEVDENRSDENSGGELLRRSGGKGGKRRQLYPDLLPDQLVNAVDYVAGTCTSGWNRTVCHGSTFSTSDGGVSSRSPKDVLLGLIVGVHMFICVTLLW